MRETCPEGKFSERCSPGTAVVAASYGGRTQHGSVGGVGGGRDVGSGRTR